jgi:hypothetical protein
MAEASDRMDLTPKLPPGRANRKALAFAGEIHRLRAAGYSFNAIRQALREAGVMVSRTTVQRELAKQPAAVPVRQPQAPRAPPSDALVSACAPPIPGALPAPAATSPLPGSYLGDARSGKEIAESFMKGRVTNPLMKG